VTAVYTSADLGIRVELGEHDPCILFSADYGTSWRVLSVHETRDLARGLCLAAERAEDEDTERFHAA
jgi:hypothetical protein